MNFWLRLAYLTVGAIAIGLSMYGAYTAAFKVEGEVSYVVIAAPLVAGVAALAPVFAEHSFRDGANVRGLFWVLALIPAGVVAFDGAYQRTHHAKALTLSERQAHERAVQRAEADLKSAKAEAAAKAAEADKYRAVRDDQCGPKCALARSAEQRANAAVTAAEGKLLASDKLKTAAPAWALPPWVLPVALDVTAFLAIWSGLSPGRKRKPKQEKAVQAQVQAPKRKPKRRPAAPPPANDNVVRGPWA